MAESIPNINNLTVLILAAGYGRRMGPFSRMVNKALVPYGTKPLISHIIDKFNVGTKFVVACGNMGQQVKDYVSTVHAEKNITFVDIPEFDEGSTGPATTIRYCKKYLTSGFLWISCDTLYEFDFSNLLDNNWIGVHPVDSNVSQDYCWVERNADNITKIRNKEHSTQAVSAFIGLMYAKDDTFINNLDNVNATEVYQGFNDNLNLKAYDVSEWKDFGTYEKWKSLTESLPEISFPKPDELFYSDNNKIVKYTTNPFLAKSKFDRAQLNKECLPTNIEHKGNFLFYDIADGETFYNCLTPGTFSKFLEWTEKSLWKDAPVSEHTFSITEDFYHKKTLDRLDKFRTKYNEWVEFSVVNGVDVKSINEYINDIDFEMLCNKTCWKFTHGDMQFDNIIFNEKTGIFTAIDWRTDFAGDMYGDIYYDLAKMLGGLYLSYKLVKEHRLEYTEFDSAVLINIPSVDSVDTYVSVLEDFVISKGLDWKKVQTLVPIIYLNMAPLHDSPFDKYLIALAQLFFSRL